MSQIRHSSLSLLTAIAALSLGGCAVSPEEDPVQIRLNDLDNRVQRIERVMSNNSLLELAQRIDALQADLRTMRGQIEQLENQGEGGKKSQRDLYGDLDRRIAALETMQMPAPATATQGGAAAGSVGGSEQSTYSSAFDALKASDYPKAIAGFKSFLAQYPASSLASNAQYWLGEAYYVTREYTSASAAFQKVTSDWPDSRKAPDALVKLGFTQFELKKYAEARDTLESVGRRYPGTEAAQLANDRLKRLPQ
jgi:tol-pal system protein YbgF